ncbi:MAG: LytR C-terminal domain-containing protein [Deltaproteobacteria bacterium]|nr:LytR C-terminal domain-containing protein [Deltaproteobacteria bacterium]
MFMRLLYSAIILVFCFMNAGCAGPAHSTGGLNNGLQSDVVRLKQDNESCQRIVGEKQAAIDQMNIEITNLNDEVEGLRSEVADLKKERQQTGKEEGLLKDQKSPLKEQTIGVEEKKGEISIPEKEGRKQEQKADVEKKDVVQTTPVEKGIGPKMLKIKVLSGNGKISSAKALSGKLAKLGYRVENIGMASRSNFDVNTVYFAPEYKNEAQQMAARLGGDTIYKPLTWPSVFHMIVVAGP